MKMGDTTITVSILMGISFGSLIVSIYYIIKTRKQSDNMKKNLDLCEDVLRELRTRLQQVEIERREFHIFLREEYKAGRLGTNN